MNPLEFRRTVNTPWDWGKINTPNPTTAEPYPLRKVETEDEREDRIDQYIDEYDQWKKERADKDWNKGVKYDGNKNRVDLLDAEFLEGVASVLTFGAKKYSENNWRNGISYSRIIGAAFRHLLAIMRGEDTDPESGLPHVDHLGCCVMFLKWHMTHRKDLDDRYKAQ